MIVLAQAGVGYWGKNHFRVFSGLKDCRLKICCDKKKEALEKIVKDDMGEVKVTTDFDDIIKDKEIDAVVITTPSETHSELAVKALSSGKHVFVEKPLALNISDAEKMVKVAKKNKKIK